MFLSFKSTLLHFGKPPQVAPAALPASYERESRPGRKCWTALGRRDIRLLEWSVRLCRLPLVGVFFVRCRRGRRRYLELAARFGDRAQSVVSYDDGTAQEDWLDAKVSGTRDFIGGCGLARARADHAEIRNQRRLSIYGVLQHEWSAASEHERSRRLGHLQLLSLARFHRRREWRIQPAIVYRSRHQWSHDNDFHVSRRSPFLSFRPPQIDAFWRSPFRRR